MKNFTANQVNFIRKAVEMIDDLNSVDRYQLRAVADACGSGFQWLTTNKEYRVGRGLYMIPTLDKEPASKPVKKVSQKDTVIIEDNNKNMEMARGTISSEVHQPEKDDLFVPFGHFADVANILKSNQFYPIFITGLSGNGKTMMVEQACAKAKRDLYRINITIETDEDDLLGGFRLVNGETVWFDGPVVQAMRTGGVLLLDEVDLASTKIMCLQPVLEGNGVFLKKINEWVKPADGFTVVATANTKGKGDDTGNFIGAGVLNEAFLERFPITMEQEYPTPATEKKIVNRLFESLGIDDAEFSDKLVEWADIIRRTYVEGAIDEIITTRRLSHIAKAYAIFGNKMKAINLCVSRFDEETKAAMSDLYTKIDAGVEEAEPASDTDDYISVDSM